VLCFTGQGVIASNNLHVLIAYACYSLIYNLYVVYVHVKYKEIKLIIMTKNRSIT
jgi:hypothetical protein